MSGLDADPQDVGEPPLPPAMSGEQGDIREDSPTTSRWEHPPSFYCPISQNCMHDPVVLSDGHSYERRHIQRWLQHHSTSPVSGLQLPQKVIFPNHALRNAIEEYFQQVFSVHRRAIRRTMTGVVLPDSAQSIASNTPLLRTINAFMQCSMLMNADLSTERVLRQIMEEARTLVGAEVASVFLIDEARQVLYSRVNSTGSELRIPVSHGIAGHVATTGEPVVIRDAYSDGRFNRAVDAKTGFRTCSMMCVPLKVKKGGVIGVVQLINKIGEGVLANQFESKARAAGSSGAVEEARTSDGSADFGADAFTPDDLQFLQVFASQAATAVANGGVLEEPQPAHRPGNPRCDLWSMCVNWFCPQEKETCSQDMVELDSAAGVEDTSFSFGEDWPSPKEGAPFKQQAPGMTGCPQFPGEAAKRLLADAYGSWELDAFALAELTDNRPLSALSEYLFDRSGLVEHFGLDREKLSRYFAEIEHGYDLRTPYHNRAHAASVLHFTHALLESGGIAESVADSFAREEAEASDRGQLQRMACLLAAAVHDYEHKGLSNEFLVRTQDDRALRYNDQHVNENHHAAAAFALLRRPECNFLSNLPPSAFRQLRSLVIDLVVGTDMSSNSKIQDLFVQLLDAEGVPSVDAMAMDAGSGSAVASEELPGLRPKTSAEAVLLLQVAIKCADLGHAAIGWDLHRRWVDRLEEEFFAQGDREKALGLPVSFLMDREKPSASQTQVGFYNFVVLPLFRALVRAAPSARPTLFAAAANCEQWRRVEAAAATTSAASSPAEASER